MICFSKPLATRDGREVRIYAQDAGGTHPIHGAIKTDEGWEFGSWTAAGTFYVDETLEDESDLVNVKLRVKQTKWFNLYPQTISNGISRGYNTKEEANVGKANGRLACVKIDFDVEEGQGL